MVASAIPWTVNARVPAGWRIDAAGDGPLGPDFLLNPIGVIFTREDAEAIVLAVNAHAALVSLARKVAAHFGDTDAPLGQAAREALAAVGPDPMPEPPSTVRR